MNVLCWLGLACLLRMWMDDDSKWCNSRNALHKRSLHIHTYTNSSAQQSIFPFTSNIKIYRMVGTGRSSQPSTFEIFAVWPENFSQQYNNWKSNKVRVYRCCGWAENGDKHIFALWRNIPKNVLKHKSHKIFPTCYDEMLLHTKWKKFHIHSYTHRPESLHWRKMKKEHYHTPHTVCHIGWMHE